MMENNPPCAPTGILVVEDSLVQAELLRRVLVKAGYGVEMAKNGEEGLQVLNEIPCALVISDIRMPLIDGYELCREIKSNEKLWHIPVILISVLSEAEDIINALNVGADSYLIKPCVEGNLLACIHSLLYLPPRKRWSEERRTLQVEYNGKHHTITADSRQILNLLLSVYDNTMSQNRELISAQTEISHLNSFLEDQVQERTAALQESETRYRHILSVTQTSNDAIIITDSAGHILNWNPSAERMFGYSEAESGGQSVTMLMPERYCDRHSAGLARVAAGGVTHLIEKNIELVGLRKDGSEFPMELSLAQWQAAASQFFCATIRDITERKASEAKIRRLTQFYAALSQCNEAIVRCGNEEELFQKVCRAIVQFGGMKMAWIGLVDEAKRVNPITSYGDGLAYLEGIEISVDENESAGRGPTGTAIREDHICWIQDFLNDPITAPWHERGARFGWGAVAALPFHRNGVVVGAFTLYSAEVNAFDEDTCKLLVEMATDISFALNNFAHKAERNLAEEQLRESEARYKRITEGLTDYQYTVRVENGRAVDTQHSLGCVTVTGYTAEDFSANPYLWIDMVVLEDRDRVREYARQVMEGKHIRPIEYRISRKDGEARWVSDTTILFRDASGKLQSYDGVIKDITERKNLDKLMLERRNEMEYLQKLQVADQTAAAIAHELNQPLMAIALYSKAALKMMKAEKPDFAEISVALEGSERQAQRAGQSIRELLTLLRSKEFPPDTFDLNQEILNILDAAKPEYKFQFDLILKLEEGLPLIRANRTQVQKVLVNLLSNSIEAMQKAGVALPSITVAACNTNEENLAQVTITDNGPGLSKEYSHRLFEPFFTTKPTGIGMGLVISRSLIEANGGRLWINPKEGLGATFHFTLPFAT